MNLSEILNEMANITPIIFIIGSIVLINLVIVGYGKK
jgi:hypothetical protein